MASCILDTSVCARLRCHANNVYAIVCRARCSRTRAAWPGKLVLSTLTVAIVYAVPQTAVAQSQSRSSGGYTRPGGSRQRTPSFGGSAWDRKPSMSGGYGRQAPQSSRSSSAGSLPRSASDQALARRSSRDALAASVSDRGRGLATSAFDRVVWIVGWGAATRLNLGDDGGRRGLVWGSGWSPPSYADRTRPQMAVEYNVLVVSPRHTSATRAYGLLSTIMPLIRAMPHGGRMPTAGLRRPRRCAKSWLSWIRGSRPCSGNPESKITYHPMRTPRYCPGRRQGGGRLGIGGMGFILLLVLVGVVALVRLAPPECWSAYPRGEERVRGLLARPISKNRTHSA